MRIAHVSATFPPYWAGTGNVAYHNARLLSERGHDVVVFTAQTPRDAELSCSFPVERLAAPLRLGNAPLTPALISGLRQFDLIHLHYPYIFGAELATIAAKRFRTPLLVTYHNDLLGKGLRGWFFKVYSQLNQRVVLGLSTHLAVTSEDYALHSHFTKTATAGFSVLPNGVDTQQFRPATEPGALHAYGVPRGVPTVLFVGALDRAHDFKGINVLLAALALTHGIHLVVVGDGDLRVHYQQQADQQLPGRTHFTGKVPLGHLIRLYQSATVTALPSTTQGEAFGMVLIESLACGTPVVASNLPGVRTVVTAGEDGLLVKAGDVDALARALETVAACPERARQMGAAGRRKVVRLYDWCVVGDRLEELYRQVLAA